MRALPVVTHSVSNPAAQLILSGQSKAGAHGDFRRNALRRAYGTPTRRAYAVFVDAAGDPSGLAGSTIVTGSATATGSARSRRMVCGVWPWGPRDLFFGVQCFGPYMRRRGAATRAGPSCRITCERGPSCVGAERSPGFSPFHSNAQRLFCPAGPARASRRVRPPRDKATSTASTSSGRPGRATGKAAGIANRERNQTSCLKCLTSSPDARWTRRVHFGKEPRRGEANASPRGG